MRVSKEERKKNAKNLYSLIKYGNRNKAALVINRSKNITNLNINKVQLLACAGTCVGTPVVVAESNDCGIKGCFVDFITAINGGVKNDISCAMCTEDFNKWLRIEAGIKITYQDEMVIMLERA